MLRIKSLTEEQKQWEHVLTRLYSLPRGGGKSYAIGCFVVKQSMKYPRKPISFDFSVLNEDISYLIKQIEWIINDDPYFTINIENNTLIYYGKSTLE